MVNPITFYGGWVLGIASLVIGIVAAYYLYKTSRTYGGKIGSSLKYIGVGTIIIIISLIILGAFISIVLDKTNTTMNEAMIVIALAVPGFLSMAIGARKLASVATEAK
jgi:phage-related holin